MKSGAVLVTVLLAGCSGVGPTADAAGNAMRAREDFVACVAPRSDFCTQEYVPVCALRRTVDACASPPCADVFERVTEPNRCVACSDSGVEGWVPGACDADPVQSPYFLDP